MSRPIKNKNNVAVNKMNKIVDKHYQYVVNFNLEDITGKTSNIDRIDYMDNKTMERLIVKYFNKNFPNLSGVIHRALNRDGGAVFIDSVFANQSNPNNYYCVFTTCPEAAKARNFTENDEAMFLAVLDVMSNDKVSLIREY